MSRENGGEMRNLLMVVLMVVVLVGSSFIGCSKTTKKVKLSDGKRVVIDTTRIAITRMGINPDAIYISYHFDLIRVEGIVKDNFLVCARILYEDSLMCISPETFTKFAQEEIFEGKFRRDYLETKTLLRGICEAREEGKSTELMPYKFYRYIDDFSFYACDPDKQFVAAGILYLYQESKKEYKYLERESEYLYSKLLYIIKHHPDAKVRKDLEEILK